jgi:CBS domain containing-hemolysin-like protein
MVSGVLTLGERSVRSIMTPRSRMSWVNLAQAPALILQQLRETPHNQLPVCRGDVDDVLGVARTKDLIGALLLHGQIDAADDRLLRKAIFLPDTAGVLKAMDTLKRARGQLLLVADEYGVVQGLLTPIDLLEAIAGEFPDEDEQPAVRPGAPGAWEADGAADLHLLEQVLESDSLVGEEAEYSSLAGFLLGRFETLPAAGDAIEVDGLRFEILAMEDRRIARVAIRRLPAHEQAAAQDK